MKAEIKFENKFTQKVFLKTLYPFSARHLIMQLILEVSIRDKVWFGLGTQKLSIVSICYTET